MKATSQIFVDFPKPVPHTMRHGLFSGLLRKARSAIPLLMVGFLLFSPALGLAAPEQPDKGLPNTSAPIFVLMDGESGALLADKDGRKSFDPGDMVKLLTAEVVFDALKRNTITLDTLYPISERAWQRGRGGSMFALLNSKVRVEDLLRGITVLSADDGAIALAEGVAGSETAFTQIMKKRVQDIGLNKFSFENSTGTDMPGQTTDARSLARLGWILSTQYPDFYRLYGEKTFTWEKIEQRNRNPLVHLEALDGLKAARGTGDGFALIGAGERDGKRLIVVVANLDKSQTAVTEAQKILRWGFENFMPRNLFAAGEAIAYGKVYGGSEREIPLVTHDPVTVLWREGAQERLTMRIDYKGPLSAPVRKDTEAGTLNIFKNGVLTLSVPVYTGAEITKGTLLQQAGSATEELSGRALRGLGHSALGWIKKKP